MSPTHCRAHHLESLKSKCTTLHKRVGFANLAYSIMIELLSRFYQYYAVQDRLPEFIDTATGSYRQSIGRDAIFINQ